MSYNVAICTEPNRWIVITTVQLPTVAIDSISSLCAKGWSAVVVGDTKTPKGWTAPNITYLSIEDQYDLFGRIAKLIPVRHYSRKNLGYLYAIRNGAQLVLETDDDNIPGEQFGNALRQTLLAQPIEVKGWVNVYRYFTDAMIWPRGLSLTAVHSAPPLGNPTEFDCPVQQFLADGDPDVDAIYRLLYRDPIDFNRRDAVVPQAGAWCPFNSQNTAFFKEAFPLLYLPCHVSFRMTDIWRSFVAQAALWAHNKRVSFHAATVRHLRNKHDLLRDFRDEVPGYVGNDEIARILDAEWELGAEGTLAETALLYWKTLISKGVVPATEQPILEAWFQAVSAQVRVKGRAKRAGN